MSLKVIDKPVVDIYYTTNNGSETEVGIISTKNGKSKLYKYSLDSGEWKSISSRNIYYEKNGLRRVKTAILSELKIFQIKE